MPFCWEKKKSTISKTLSPLKPLKPHLPSACRRKPPNWGLWKPWTWRLSAPMSAGVGLRDVDKYMFVECIWNLFKVNLWISPKTHSIFRGLPFLSKAKTFFFFFNTTNFSSSLFTFPSRIPMEKAQIDETDEGWIPILINICIKKKKRKKKDWEKSLFQSKQHQVCVPL